MTTITLNHRTRPALNRHGLIGSASSFVASFSDFCAGVRDGKEIESRYRRYSRMSQPDLADIGLTRPDIYRAALIGRPV